MRIKKIAHTAKCWLPFSITLPLISAILYVKGNAFSLRFIIIIRYNQIVVVYNEIVHTVVVPSYLLLLLLLVQLQLLLTSKT